MHKKLNNLINLLEDSLLVFTLSAMILLALSQIVLRNVFGSGIEWTDPLLRVLVMWLGLLGAIASTRQDKHITIDLFSRMLPEVGTKIAAIVNNLFSAIICAFIGYHSARFVIMEYDDGIVAFADVPAWVCEIIIPIGFFLMSFRFFINAGHALKPRASVIREN